MTRDSVTINRYVRCRHYQVCQDPVRCPLMHDVLECMKKYGTNGALPRRFSIGEKDVATLSTTLEKPPELRGKELRIDLVKEEDGCDYTFKVGANNMEALEAVHRAGKFMHKALKALYSVKAPDCLLEEADGEVSG